MKTLMRGNALLVAMIAMALLTMLVTGAIVFTGQNQRAASSKASSDEVKACADLARRYVFSRLKVFGNNVKAPSELILTQTIVDDYVVGKRSTISSRHYDETVDRATGTVIPKGSIAQDDNAPDIANVINLGNVRGSSFGIVMLCQQASGRQSEVEFVFKFGI